MSSEAEFSNLLDKFLADNLTLHEKERLFELISGGEYTSILKDKIYNSLSDSPASKEWSKEMEEEVLNRLLSAVQEKKGYSVPFSIRRLISIAAILIIVIGAGYFTWFYQTTPKRHMIAEVNRKQISPGKDGAILTLSNGQQIVLDNADNGQLTIQGNSQVTKENGQLIYNNAMGNEVNSVVYNTLATPRGRQFEVTLPDGTSVWLNAGSSITYPTSFSGNSRIVSTTGEVYFEVAKNPEKPFHVKVRDMEVTVLGTHFNINAYENENSIKTTLLEGSVKITKGDQAGILKPGQQAEVYPNNNSIKIREDADTDLTLAWKNGFTSFKSADIKTIMRQVERWYDVDVSFEGNLPERTFTADVSRTAPISQFLKILEESNIHYRIENRKIIIIP